jgi:putative transposase
VISFEDLNMKAMQMMWGRKISDLAFSSFLKILEHQATKYGTKIVTIGRFFPSSKTCSDCGHVLEELGMNERIWTCPACGKTHKRDENAAINIRRVGASTLGVETVNLDIAS